MNSPSPSLLAALGEKQQHNFKHTLINLAIPLLFSMAGFAVSFMAATTTRSDQRETVESIEEEKEEEEEDQITTHHCFDASQATASESDEGVEITIVPVEESESGLVREDCQRTCNAQKMGIGMEELWLMHVVAMKEKELKCLELEIARNENLGLKLDAMETELHHAADGRNNLLQVEAAELEIKSLKKKLRRLHRANSRSFCMIRRQAATIRLIESQKEQEKQELKDMVAELRSIIDQMEEQNKELQNKLKVGETKMPIVEEIQSELDKLVVRVEQLQMERISELEELIYLRWVNACLRYEIFRSNQEQAKTEKTEEERLAITREFYQEEEEEKVVCSIGHEWGSPVDVDTCNISGHGSCTKPVLFQRLKKWVKKKERCRKPPLSDSEDQEQFITIEQIPGRNSC